VSNLGIAQKCEGLIAFRVDHDTISPGSKVRRYYMHKYGRFIDQMQSFIEAGSASLAQHLSAAEWQQLDLSDKRISLESDVVKMMVVLEAIFEHTRKKFASHLPSRLDCVFVWSTLELAKKFRQQYFPEGVIHRCKIRGEAVELDGGFLPPGINLSNLSLEIFSAEFHATQLRAKQYWTAQESPNLAELLVVGNVEVVRIEKTV
jgi:Protein of unknown function (DUF2441)